MKLITYQQDGQAARVGALLDEHHAVDLQDAATRLLGATQPHLVDMLALLDGGPTAMDATRALLERARTDPTVPHLPLTSLRLLAPVPRPRSIRDCMAFEKHVVQATRAVARTIFAPAAWADGMVERLTGRALIGAPGVWYRQPTYYKSNVFSVVGPGADVLWPRYSNQLDFELEFGVFLYRTGKDIRREDARSFIAGYTIFNDFSARDTQFREMKGRLGPAKGKDFDTGNVLGPCLVTSDEVPDPYALTMRARVNGEVWGEGNSRDMFHRFEDLISYISQDETLHPGEFIGSGTVGNGCGLELGRWLKDGDVVELEIEGLGVLRNRVVRRLP